METLLAMHSARAGQQIVRQLCKIRSRFDDATSAQKLELLQQLHNVRVRTGADLKQLHAALCYLRAFPDSISHYTYAAQALQSFAERVNKLSAAERKSIGDSGIVGTPIHYEFSYEVATWLARKTSGEVSIDWSQLEDTSKLDDLLAHLLQSVEEEYFDSGYISSEEWLNNATAHSGKTSFDWLIAQLSDVRCITFWSQLYNSAEIPLAWTTKDNKLSKSLNTVAIRGIRTRDGGMRKRVRNTRKEIAQPVHSSRKVTRRKASRLIDSAMAALAVRHRETYHFNHANTDEVYVADIGEGTSIAIFGLLPEYRFALECTMGFLLLSNWVPIGYGGASVLFRQVNTGINIFDEYRASEAAYLWVQTMRVYHHLTGCTRFIANAYQFGGDNDEALKSGAFWFYYRLGYRPILANIRKLAQREADRILRNPSYRSDLSTLRRLGSCDMHFTMPGARPSELFNEQWIETSSMLAAQQLDTAGGTSRAAAADRVLRKVGRDLGLRSMRKWSKFELASARRLAPIIASACPATWTSSSKKLMRKLLRAKGGPAETDYARLLFEHDEFRNALRANCRQAEIGQTR